MVYNEQIEARVLSAVAGWQNLDAKKMFGGVCHLINGNMFCGVLNDFLILRLGEAAAKKAMEEPFTKPFDITGRPMKGWVMVAREGFSEDAALKNWLEAAKAFAETLPPK